MSVNTIRTFPVAVILVFFLLTALVFVGCTMSSGDKMSSSPTPQSDPPDPPGNKSGAGDPSPAADAVKNGSLIFAQRGCMGCYTVNGNGGKVGPNLSNEANAGHSRQWLTIQIRDPKKNDPTTLMPAYDTLTDEQVSNLVSYLLSLSTEHSKAGQTSSDQTANASSPSPTASFTMEDAGQRWAQVCGQCHNLRSPSEYSDAQWEVAVHPMRIRVPLTGQEQTEILAFLKTNN